MLKYILLTIVIFLSCERNLSAQVTSSASASANIVMPIQINKTSDLDFGNFSTNGTSGTIVLVPGIDAKRLPSYSITVCDISFANARAATFTIARQDNFEYNLVLPTNNHLIYNGESTMLVNGFICSDPKLTSDGTETIFLGATLNVSAEQAAGSYASAGSTIEIIVNYN